MLTLLNRVATYDQHLVSGLAFTPCASERLTKRNRGTTFLVGPFLGPAIAGYIGAGTNWRDSFGVLTALYGLSTLMVLLFGRETYYAPSKPVASRFGAYFGIGNTKLPKCSTLAYWCRKLVVYVFRFPLLMTGEWLVFQQISLGTDQDIGRLRDPGDVHLAYR